MLETRVTQLLVEEEQLPPPPHVTRRVFCNATEIYLSGIWRCAFAYWDMSVVSEVHLFTGIPGQLVHLFAGIPET
jgi:hypothetical protein